MSQRAALPNASELTLRADQVTLHLTLVVDAAERQVGKGRADRNAGDALQAGGTERYCRRKALQVSGDGRLPYSRLR